MRILLYGKDSINLGQIVKDTGFEVVTEQPDTIISFGGDGTLLFAEREYPGIPKLPIRNSQFCHKCPQHQDELILKKLLEGSLKLKEHKKLHTDIYGKDLSALNDFVVRNELPTHAIRFRVQPPHHPERAEGSINNNLYIGDGIVVSTSFGSTGYFESISRESFEDEGIFAIAFNNTTKKVGPLYFEKNLKAGFELVRGKAALTSDNDPNIYHLSEGAKLTFKLSGQVAKIYEDTSLRCPNCKIRRE